MSHGLLKARVRMLLGLFAASRKGEFATVDPTLEHLLGRAARYPCAMCCRISSGHES